MFKKMVAKWVAIVAGTAFAGLSVAGCDSLQQIVDQVLGVVGAA